jgi:hypothetical protein
MIQWRVWSTVIGFGISSLFFPSFLSPSYFSWLTLQNLKATLQLFSPSDLLNIFLIIIYIIWNNLSNYNFFSISSYFNSSCIRSVSILFIAIFLFEILFARKNYSKHHIVYSIYYMPSLFWKLYKTSFINKIFQINQKNPIYIRKPKNLILLSFHLTFLVSH